MELDLEETSPMAVPAAETIAAVNVAVASSGSTLRVAAEHFQLMLNAHAAFVATSAAEAAEAARRPSLILAEEGAAA